MFRNETEAMSRMENFSGKNALWAWTQDGTIFSNFLIWLRSKQADRQESCIFMKTGEEAIDVLNSDFVKHLSAAGFSLVKTDFRDALG